MKGWRRGAAVVASIFGLVNLGAGISSAQTLPGQASPVADEHTHGPDGLDLDRRGRPTPAAGPYAVDAHAVWAEGQHDGALTTEDVADLSTAPKFHAIYVYPSDKPTYATTRFKTYASMFQADARAASELLYGRAVRFDERGSGMLDITVFRSRYNSKQLAGARQFNLVNDELLAAKNADGTVKFDGVNKKYVVWLDAGSKYCGQGHLSQDRTRAPANRNEGRTLAIVYRPYDLNDRSTGGFCRGRTLLHELGHTMGALQSGAPNAFDGAHCDDSGEDTMCYTSASSTDTGGPVFDYSNDDYWDPMANPALGSNTKLSWWTVNLSTFLCDTTSSCSQPASTPPY